MKTTGESSIPKFLFLVFLGHPTQHEKVIIFRYERGVTTDLLDVQINRKNIKVVLCWICNQQEWSTVRPDHWAALGGHIWGEGGHIAWEAYDTLGTVQTVGGWKFGTLSFGVCVVLVHSNIEYAVNGIFVTRTSG